MGPGEFFGEAGIIGDSPGTATVRAATDLDALSIHRDCFTSLLDCLPSWRERVFDGYRRQAMEADANGQQAGVHAASSNRTARPEEPR